MELQATPTAPTPASSSTPNVSRETTTFESCARTYVAAQAPGWKSGKHAKQWLSTLETYAFPVMGKLDVAAVAVTVLDAHIESAICNGKGGTIGRFISRAGRRLFLLGWVLKERGTCRRGREVWRVRTSPKSRCDFTIDDSVSDPRCLVWSAPVLSITNT
jgi:hypothetical protein